MKKNKMQTNKRKWENKCVVLKTISDWKDVIRRARDENCLINFDTLENFPFLLLLLLLILLLLLLLLFLLLFFFLSLPIIFAQEVVFFVCMFVYWAFCVVAQYSLDYCLEGRGSPLTIHFF